MQEASDIRLVRECRRGGESAFEAFFDRFERRIFLFALQMVGNRDDAMDISQVCFIKAFKNLHQFDTRRTLQPWLFRIVRNQCIDFLRKKKNTRPRPIEAMDKITARSDDPAVLVEKKEAHKQIWAAINQLSLPEREAIILREFHEMSYKEVEK